MQAAIQNHLATIAQQYGATILYACESGSRAWGFASPNSDYDVRFLYIHPRDWYLSISEKRDVIEYLNDGVLDINGWDMRKALRLLRKGNAALREWLHSPIVYLSQNDLFVPVLELARQAFLPETLCHHYLALTHNSLAALKGASQAKLKTYLYALRPLLCCQWIIEHNTQPPMLIDKLLTACLAEGAPELRNYVDRLLSQKRQAEERSVIDRSDMFERFLQRRVQELEPHIPKNPPKLANAAFDHLFKTLVSHCSEA